MSISYETQTKIVRYIGQFLVDHADELFAVEYSAEIAAEQEKIRAQGEADATKIKAEAEASANELVAKSLTSELIENNKINKWDGKLPYIQGSDATIVDVGNIGGK